MQLAVRKSLIAAVGVLLVAMALAACGGGGSSSSEASTESAETSNEGGEGASLAAAKEEIAEFIGHPSKFPVNEKLNELPKGKKVAMLFTGSPVGQLQTEAAEEAAKVLGMDFVPIKAGPSAAQTQSGADTAVAMHPDAVFISGLPMELWSKQAEEFQEAGTPIVVGGSLNTEKYGVKAPLFAKPWAEQVGKLLASYVATEFGTNSQVVFYIVPELEFTKIDEQAFIKQLGAICPGCSVRTASITLEEVGTTAPSTVVSDLQAHPETNVTVFSAAEAMVGLPQALAAAGLKVKSFGVGPTPTTLQYIKEGKVTAGLGVDIATSVWQQMDQVAREIIGQELQPGSPQAEGTTDMQFLTQKDITFDPSKGWTGYPEYKERFEKLWGLK